MVSPRSRDACGISGSASASGQSLTDIVVGSGPAGVSAAKALLARGRPVTMIDVGEQLEPELENRRAALAASDPQGWSEDALAAYKAPQLAQADGEIRRYGSDFPVRDPFGLVKEQPGWLALRSSVARGGLSNTWGASVLPYRQEDMAGWPITANDLGPHYKAVADFMPVAGTIDALQAFFPAFDMSGRRQLALSGQAAALLKRIDDRRGVLGAMRFVAGAARQAAHADCRRCGACLHGCPYEYIFKASQALPAMQRDPRFEYRGSLRAMSFEESNNSVRLICRRVDGSSEIVQGERLFIGAGVLPTALIMLNALGGDRQLVLLDSQHFFLPLLHLWKPGEDPAKEQLHTMTQVFIELSDPQVSPHTIHAQLYTYNEFYAADMKRRYGRLLPFGGPMFEAFSRRLIASQIFLHSDHSHRIGLKLAAGGEQLEASLTENPNTGAVARKAKAAYAKAAAKLGLFAIGAASRFGAPGSSFHVGGSLPMRRTPQKLETDALGRISGLERVHVVDASVLPAIPATTITFAVMANAHRIASQAP